MSGLEELVVGNAVVSVHHLGQLQIVGHRDAADGVFVANAKDGGHQLLAHVGVEVARGLIQQKDLRSVNEGSGDGPSLGFATAELRWASLGTVLEPQAFQHVQGSFSVFAAPALSLS